MPRRGVRRRKGALGIEIEPNFFSTHLSAMLTKTEHKFYFFISFLLHNTSTLQHTSGHPPGWVPPRVLDHWACSGLRCTIFFPS